MRDIKSWKFLAYVILLACGTRTCAQNQAASVVETMESSALRVELNTSPYSYRVLEKSGGEVLLAESGAITFTTNGYTVRSATDVTGGGGWMKAVLHLEGTSVPAQVSFKFVKPEVLQVALTFNNGVEAEIREEFADQGEHYYGIWEMPFGGNIDNRGADHDFMGMRHQVDVNYASARAPFYATSKKYGVYVETTAKGRFAIAQGGKTSFSFFDTQLKYDVIYGPSYREIFARYNEMAGPAIMPPTWAFGSIWWRDDHHADLRRAKNAQEKVIEDADKLRALHIPAGAIWLDRPFGTGEMGWGNMDFDESFPDPPKMIGDLRERGMNLLIWVANRAWNQLQTEGSARRYLYFGRGSAADMKNPYAYVWFKDKLNEYVRLGVKGYKIDRGEEDELPLADENINAILFPKMAAEGLRDLNGDGFFNFTRNVNDTARRYTAVWNGDTRSTFAGLEVSIKTGLRSGAINFPMWGSDTGGYIRVPEKELFARWLEFSAFSPMMEILIGPKRTIWDDYDDELVGIAKTYVGGHHDLIPYTRSYLYQATQTGMPVMRSLIFAYPDEVNFSDTWDEYLYGNEILVAPVTTAGAVSRSVTLPAGKWINYNDKKTMYDGAKNVTVPAPLGTIPVFVREGAIIPRGDIIKLNNNWEASWKTKLRIEIFLPAKAANEFNYFTGTGVQKIAVAPSADGLTIEFGDLGTPGTLEIYCRGAKEVVTGDGRKLREGRDYSYDANLQKLTVAFQGATRLKVRGAASLFN
ncbi:MAG TPA: TIM-barrel domain-containing protein [Candidatus Sulfotelmatobacter sp.]|jgi:alpha-D-xyloside xylohydrolase|nr:TIM-barrel domain-containing protein [Candidatus Sulfotelmatobacter sp.]